MDCNKWQMMADKHYFVMVRVCLGKRDLRCHERLCIDNSGSICAFSTCLPLYTTFSILTCLDLCDWYTTHCHFGTETIFT